MTEVHLVQVHLEDAVLGVAALELQRQHGLLELALQALVGGQEQDLRQLLGDGAATFDDATAPVILHDGPGDADGVDAPVRVEATVLHGQHRVAQGLGDLGQGHEDAALRVELGDQLVVVVVDFRA
jgi:hypothetical protein